MIVSWHGVMRFTELAHNGVINSFHKFNDEGVRAVVIFRRAEVFEHTGTYGWLQNLPMETIAQHGCFNALKCKLLHFPPPWCFYGNAVLGFGAMYFCLLCEMLSAYCVHICVETQHFVPGLEEFGGFSICFCGCDRKQASCAVLTVYLCDFWCKCFICLGGVSFAPCQTTDGKTKEGEYTLACKIAGDRKMLLFDCWSGAVLVLRAICDVRVGWEHLPLRQEF